MNGDVAIELGDGVILSFVEVCLSYHLRGNYWKWTHLYVTLFFLKMLNFLAEVSSVGFFDCIHSATYANNIFQHG